MLMKLPKFKLVVLIKSVSQEIPVEILGLVPFNLKFDQIFF